MKPKPIFMLLQLVALAWAAYDAFLAVPTGNIAVEGLRPSHSLHLLAMGLIAFGAAAAWIENIFTVVMRTVVYFVVIAFFSDITYMVVSNWNTYYDPNVPQGTISPVEYAFAVQGSCIILLIMTIVVNLWAIRTTSVQAA